MSTCRGMINFKQGWLDINKFLNTKNWLLWVRLRKYVLNFLFKCFMWRQEEPVHAVQDLRYADELDRLYVVKYYVIEGWQS